jgi:hypothetical protein
LAAVGLTDVEVVPTHGVGDGLHGAIIRATKPATPLAAALPEMPALPQPISVVGDGCGCGAAGCC